MQSILRQIDELIFNFVAKGNKKEDIILKMGYGFYERFVEACEKESGFTVTSITSYTGIQIERTHLLGRDMAAIINEKRILEEAMKVEQ